MIYDRVSILAQQRVERSQEQLTAGLFITNALPSEQKVYNIVLPEIDTTTSTGQRRLSTFKFASHHSTLDRGLFVQKGQAAQHMQQLVCGAIVCVARPGANTCVSLPAGRRSIYNIRRDKCHTRRKIDAQCPGSMFTTCVCL